MIEILGANLFISVLEWQFLCSGRVWNKVCWLEENLQCWVNIRWKWPLTLLESSVCRRVVIIIGQRSQNFRYKQTLGLPNTCYLPSSSVNSDWLHLELYDQTRTSLVSITDGISSCWLKALFGILCKLCIFYTINWFCWLVFTYTYSV